MMSFEKFSRITQSRFIRSIAVLSGGNAIAQVIPLLAAPVIARLFDASEFGAAALFISLSNLVANNACLRYDNAIVLPQHTADANNIAKIAFLSAISVSAATLLIVITFDLLSVTPSWLAPLGNWRFALPLSIAILALGFIATGIDTRQRHFRVLAGAAASNAVVSTGTRVTTGVLGAGLSGLIVSSIVGSVAQLYVLSLPIRRLHHAIFSRTARGELLPLIREYRQFPLYSLPTGILRSLGQDLPIFALAAIYDPAIVGLYAMSNRLLRMPIALITNAVQRTYLVHAAEQINDGQSIKRALLLVSAGLAGVGIVIFLPVLLFGEELFAFVLGDRWAGAGRFAELMAPYLYLLFIQAPSAATFVALRRQQILLVMQILSTAAAAGVFVFASMYSKSADIAIAGYAITGCVVSILIIAMAIWVAGKGTPDGIDKNQ